MSVQGRIHSLESFGAVDGPGIRFVVFFQGCPLRCLFCHNPDSWDLKEGTLTDSEELTANIYSYKNYLSGGVTFSGGEPMLQKDFCLDLMERLQEKEMHVAIDTSGIASPDSVKDILDKADLLLLDIKSFDEKMCEKISGFSNKHAIDTLKYRESIQKPVWIRHVILPGYTLDYSLLEEMAEYLSAFSCIEKIECLPFHKMGEFKWQALNKEYQLTDVQPPTAEEMQAVREIFRKKGFLVS